MPRRVTGGDRLAALAVLLPGLLFLQVVRTAGELDYRTMAVGAVGVVVSGYLALRRSWGGDLLRGPTLYFGLFVVFHLGLVVALGAGGEQLALAVSRQSLYWVRTAYLQPAVGLVCVAVLVYVAVCVLLSPGRRAEPSSPAVLDDMPRSLLGAAGLSLQALGLLGVGMTVLQAGGLRILTGGYIRFLESAQSQGMAYGIWAIGVGSCLTQLGHRRVRRAGVVVFGAFALVMFPIGLRGSVLFPAAVILATRSIMGRRPRPAVLATAVVGVLSLASVVRLTRIGGAADSGGAWYSGALGTVTELGFSIRPTLEALRWEESGLAHTAFISFVAVPVRFAEALAGVPEPTTDLRLFNVKVAALSGPIGGSPVAEGYDAAGTLGVVLTMAAIAAVVALISRDPTRSPIGAAIFPVVFLPLTIAVRNSFAPVVVQIALGLAVVLVATRHRAPASRHRGRRAPDALAR